MTMKKLISILKEDNPKNLMSYLERFFNKTEIDWLVNHQIIVFLNTEDGKKAVFNIENANRYLGHNLLLKYEPKLTIDPTTISLSGISQSPSTIANSMKVEPSRLNNKEKENKKRIIFKEDDLIQLVENLLKKDTIDTDFKKDCRQIPIKNLDSVSEELNSEVKPIDIYKKYIDESTRDAIKAFVKKYKIGLIKTIYDISKYGLKHECIEYFTKEELQFINCSEFNFFNNLSLTEKLDNMYAKIHHYEIALSHLSSDIQYEKMSIQNDSDRTQTNTTEIKYLKKIRKLLVKALSLADYDFLFESIEVFLKKNKRSTNS